MYIYAYLDAVWVEWTSQVYINIYPVTNKLSDAKVKRQGYKLALFFWGGGPFCVDT